MKVDPKKAFVLGQQRQQSTYEDEELGKLGTFRGGNAAIVWEGVPTGQCPRLVHMRTNRGWQPPPEEADYQPDGICSRELMWGKGRFNEEFHNQKIEAGLPEDLKLMREGELTVSYQGETYDSSGRPDAIIVRREDEAPVHLLEYKAICGSSMAIKALNGKPKLAHIVQAFNYMHHLGVTEGSLIYTSSDYRRLSFYEQGQVISPDHPLSDAISFNYYKAYPTAHASSKKGWTRKPCSYEQWEQARLESFRVDGKIIPVSQWDVNQLRPFSVWFPLRVMDGAVEWQHLGEWRTTGISPQHIHDFYEMCLAMKEEGALLPPRPVALEASMEPDKWGPCGLCPLAEVCQWADRNEVKDVKTWEELVAEFFSEEEA